jgi:hypothetical protein
MVECQYGAAFSGAGACQRDSRVVADRSLLHCPPASERRSSEVCSLYASDAYHARSGGS